MALNTVLETLDGVDDAVKSFYTETDGKFVLALEGLDNHPEVRGVITANKANSEKAKERQARIEALEKQLAETGKAKPDEAAILKMRQDLEAERDKHKGDADAWQQRYASVTRDRALTEALNVAGIKEPAFVKAATAMLAGSVKMADDKPVVETDMGPMDLGAYVKRWAATEGAAFVQSPAGGGAMGSKGGGVTGRTMTRGEFEKLSPEMKQHAMLKDKVSLTD